MKINILNLIITTSILLWSSITNAQTVNSVAISNSNIWVNTETGLYQLTNNGQTWTKMGKGGYISNFAAGGLTLLKGTLFSTDNGESWNELKKPGYSPIEGVAINETGIFVSTNPYGKGVAFSTNNGKSWKKRNRGLKKAYIEKLIIAGPYIYAVGKHTYTGNYFSTNNGKNWKKVKDSSYDYFLYNAVAVNGTTIYDGGKDELRISTDNGVTWTKVKNKLGKSFRSLAVSGTNIYAVFDKYIYLSTNNGVDWTPIINGEEEARLTKEKAEREVRLAKEKAEKEIRLAKEKAEKEIRLAKEKAIADSLNVIKIAKEARKKIIMNYLKGVAELYYNNIDTAIKKFSDAIDAKPDFAEAWKKRAECYHKINQYDKETADSLALSKISSSLAVSSTNKENMLFAEELKKNEKDVNDPTINIHYVCYYKDDNGSYLLGQKASSNLDKVTYFTKAIELNNTKAEYYIARGDAYTKLEKYNSATEDYKKAIQVNPNCEWYDYKFDKMETCPKCQGDGYTIEVRFSTQEVNNKKNVSGGDSNHIPCKECKNGKIKNSFTFKAVRLTK